jgi:uncharacterized protein YggE
MFRKIYLKLQTREGITLVASLALVVATSGFIFGGFHHGGPHSDGPGTEATIAVTGNGESFAIPDVAQFTFTITKDAKTMAEAQKQVSELGNGLVEKLQAAGIDKKDIKTEGFNAYPKYENKTVAVPSPCSAYYCAPSYNNNPVIVGYTVSHTYSVKVRNLDNASDIAKLLTDANVSSINGPDFTVDDIEAVQNEARDKAIVDAKAQAKILARQLGVRLGDIIDFQVIENGNYPMPMYARASLDAGMAEKVAAPDIEPGQSDIKVQVQITYRIR